MRLTLKPHPETPCAAVREIAVEVTRKGMALTLRFALNGEVGAVAFPEWREAARADDLWRRTCFEAFVGDVGGPGYAEINLSPSNQWAIYAFDGYRDGMRSVDGVERRAVERDTTADRFLFATTLDLDRLTILPATAPWRLGLSAVIELKDGSKSYWALTHAPGKPDFHHPDAFAAVLPPESP
ncbi:MAG: DOMON-like domain-containing protein [Caulobacteraceae bacterium]|nr:MAG: DOMON-like domain-containing protein [Caulobacteraceae bacterium]